ncbi:elongation factor Tu, putative [Plasmodium berghei]|uniref:Elongation factor Tu, putative n=2 Tax=Plasmodium berghei TaxID=5821 RepID=A0A509AJ23_PLABA|nr:elongation factor Tu, putative [Plasmodium berghei ANKA]CXI36350.1 elongation factor Tu, putative [Plasmodium berghei]SCM21581.1 elongation factor Tu, putative [Plasmodium berghei]SCN24781.1 elongation factor Tu, putative [Plasmodium berghei]SCO59912.1 elongation factor Tu, putative [Plasmodium berghei]SCO61254.1 elongation factor Tu, putative [Plasmodium berghei]|eukprot:XP_034421292.1 elongation factor Tu, putative [Plasmodium berghei ANKA]
MSNRKGGKKFLYEDYEDYDEENYIEYEFKENANNGKNKIRNSNKNDNKCKSESNSIPVKHTKMKEKANNKNEVNIVMKADKDEKSSKYIMLGTLNILVLGHIDAGKSTLIGALLYNLNYVNDQILKKYEKIRESSKYTYILDEEDERERNITLFNKRKEFFIFYTNNDINQSFCDIIYSKKSCENIYINKNIFEDLYKRNVIHKDIVCFRKVNIFDTPGHNELVNNLHACSFFADCAILVVDANNIYNKKNDETYRNVCILKSVGISNIIIVINKIDLFDYDEKIFNDICKTIKTYFECEKNDSIYEFICDNNFYLQEKYPQNSDTKNLIHKTKFFERNLIFIPISAYKNENIVKFEKSNIPLFNKNYSLYDEIKFINLKRDMFLLKVCHEHLSNFKTCQQMCYYNFIHNDGIGNSKLDNLNEFLFANNIFYNRKNKSEISLNPVKKSLNENNNTFLGIIQDYTESNNMIKASIKILNGFLKIKNNYTILPFKEKIIIKNIEKKNSLFKYININDLCDYLLSVKDFNYMENISLNLPNSTTTLNEQTEMKEKNVHDTNASFQNNFINFIKILSEIAKKCTVNECVNINDDIVDNVFIKIDENKIINGSLLVSNTTTDIQINSPYTINNIFTYNKLKALIKINDIKIPLIIGRNYLFYSLNYLHSVTIKNVYYVYKTKDSSNNYTISNNKLKIDCNEHISTQIGDLKNYKKKNMIFYEKTECKKCCLRSYDIGIVEIQINNNTSVCTQYFRNELQYFITSDGAFFNAYDFLSFSISPLSRFILSEENKIVASGLVLK